MWTIVNYNFLDNWRIVLYDVPITVTARSKAWIVFARSKSGIVGSDPTEGMDVRVCVYSVFVLSCVQVAALRRADPSFKESYRLCKKDYETEEEPRAQPRAIEPLMIEWMNCIVYCSLMFAFVRCRQ
jgi:hypothetical protein